MSPPRHDVLIVNINCNIYSSAKYVLEFLHKMKLPKPGSWIYFDEFGSRDHEFRAFREFVDAPGMGSKPWLKPTTGGTSRLRRIVQHRVFSGARILSRLARRMPHFCPIADKVRHHEVTLEREASRESTASADAGKANQRPTGRGEMDL